MIRRPSSCGARSARRCEDPKLAEMLAPKNTIGCKRLCIDIGYYETFNQPNVELIDVSGEPIEAITAKGVRARGKDYEVDAIVFATGFDAMTGALLNIDIRGRGGLRIQDKWSEGPRTYLGVAMAGFPNLFTITGPGSPSVLTNMLPTIEQHVEWIAGVLEHMRDRQLGQIEPVVGGGGGMGRARQRGCRPHAALYLQLLVPGREHSGQAARVHALYRRLSQVRAALQRDRGQRLRGVRADVGWVNPGEGVEAGGRPNTLRMQSGVGSSLPLDPTYVRMIDGQDEHGQARPQSEQSCLPW